MSGKNKEKPWYKKPLKGKSKQRFKYELDRAFRGCSLSNEDLERLEAIAYNLDDETRAEIQALYKKRYAEVKIKWE